MDKQKKKQLLETFSHYLTGGIVILKAYDKSEHFDEHPFIVIALFVLGFFIIISTFFHHYMERHVKEFKSLLHFTEFIVLCLVSYYYWQEGKKAIPILYFIAAIINLAVGIFFYNKKVKSLKSALQKDETLSHQP